MNYTLFKNCFIIVGAFIVPLLLTVTYNVSFLVLHTMIYLSVSLYFYALINNRKQKRSGLTLWFEDKSKSRDLVFSNLTSFIKHSIVIIPFSLLSLFVIDHSNNSLNKDSLIEITMSLLPFIWLYSLLINGHHAYKNALHH